MCLQGASALDQVLHEIPQEKLKVFVVWEPVLSTDKQPPSSSVLARVTDGRVVQCWDGSTLVSRALSGPLIATGRARVARSNVVWDTVAVYEPGVRWEEAAPNAAFVGGPVVGAAGGLRTALGAGL